MTPPLRRLALVLTVLAVLATALPAAAAHTDPARWVDPLIGTAPVGFVFPGAVRPHGMVQVSPDTEVPFAYSGYLYTDATSAASVWCICPDQGCPRPATFLSCRR